MKCLENEMAILHATTTIAKVTKDHTKLCKYSPIRPPPTTTQPHFIFLCGGKLIELPPILALMGFNGYEVKPLHLIAAEEHKSTVNKNKYD